MSPTMEAPISRYHPQYSQYRSIEHHQAATPSYPVSNVSDRPLTNRQPYEQELSSRFARRPPSPVSSNASSAAGVRLPPISHLLNYGKEDEQTAHQPVSYNIPQRPRENAARADLSLKIAPRSPRRSAQAVRHVSPLAESTSSRLAVRKTSDSQSNVSQQQSARRPSIHTQVAPSYNSHPNSAASYSGDQMQQGQSQASSPHSANSPTASVSWHASSVTYAPHHPRRQSTQSNSTNSSSQTHSRTPSTVATSVTPVSSVFSHTGRASTSSFASTSRSSMLPSPPSPGDMPRSAPPTTTTLPDRYSCPSCNKAFSRPSSLKIHTHSHTGEKPFRCPNSGCGKAFSVRSNMKRHQRGCHVGNGDVCNGRGSSVEDMEIDEDEEEE